jgi:uncharacterized protein YndB with AHSA1/START domain
MRPAIRHSTFIGASPEAVYDALATGAGLDSWFTSGAEVDAREGGSIRFRWRGHGLDRIDADDGGAVLRADRGHRFTFQWHPSAPDRPTTVDVRLAPWGRGTRVDLEETGYGESEEDLAACLGCAVGWGEALTLLKYALEQPGAYLHPSRWAEAAAPQEAGRG